MITAAPLAVSLTVALLAAWRRWAPPLAVAVTSGLVLRIYLAAVSAHNSWQPPDFGYHFTDAIQAVLHHQDPLRLPNSEWHFLPTMAYLNAGAYRLGAVIHVPWQVMGRAVPVGADLVLILLVGALAGTGERRRRAALQYALNPLPIMICAIHGQLEPVASALVVGSLLLAMRARPRPHTSGALFGLSIAVGSWPALLIPGLVHLLRGRRARLTALAWACAVPLAFFVTAPAVVGYPARLLGGDIHALLSPRSAIGDWGWTTLVTGGDQEVNPSWARVGMLIAAVVFAVVWYLWRRAHPLDLMTALSLGFLTSSYRVNSQYLVWPVPYQLARPSRGTQVALLLCGAWDGIGYLWLSQARTDHDWWLMHSPWAFSSLAILPFLVIAMPWRRRAGAPIAGAAPEGAAAGPGGLRTSPVGQAGQHTGTTVPAAGPAAPAGGPAAGTVPVGTAAPAPTAARHRSPPTERRIGTRLYRGSLPRH